MTPFNPPEAGSRIPDEHIAKLDLPIEFDTNTEMQPVAIATLQEQLYSIVELNGSHTYEEQTLLPVDDFSPDQRAAMNFKEDATHIEITSQESSDYLVMDLRTDENQSPGNISILMTARAKYSPADKVEPIRGSVSLHTSQGDIAVSFIVPSGHGSGVGHLLLDQEELAPPRFQVEMQANDQENRPTIEDLLNAFDAEIQFSNAQEGFPKYLVFLKSLIHSAEDTQTGQELAMIDMTPDDITNLSSFLNCLYAVKVESPIDSASLAIRSIATSITPTSETTKGAKDEESLVESDIKIARYNPQEQMSLASLDDLYPEWKAEHPDVDPELLLFDFVRTMEERRIGSERGISSHFSPAEGVEKAIDRIPDEVGKRFQGHGIAGKYGSSSSELDSLLKNGIQTGRTLYTTELRNNPAAGAALGADMPFTEGGLVVVGDIDKHLIDGGIKYVIVGDQYIKAFDVMKTRYPDYTFIPWHEAPEYFCSVVNDKEGTNHNPKKMNYAESYEQLDPFPRVLRKDPISGEIPPTSIV